MTSVPWIPLFTSWPRHKKTMALRRILGTAEPIIGLWCWAAENAPDGDMSEFSIEELENVSGWTGEPGKAFKAMVDVHFIDDVSDDVSANKYVLHEWMDGAGAKVASYLKRKRQQRDLMRARRGDAPDPEEDQIQSKTEKKKKKRVSNQLALTSPSQAFTQFWTAYPRKTGKGQAMKAWPGDDLLPAILAALAWQAPTWDPKFTKHPATWLNARCWEDEKPQPSLFSKPARDPSVGSYPASREHPTKTGRLELP